MSQEPGNPSEVKQEPELQTGQVDRREAEEVDSQKDEVGGSRSTPSPQQWDRPEERVERRTGAGMFQGTLLEIDDFRALLRGETGFCENVVELANRYELLAKSAGSPGIG